MYPYNRGTLGPQPSYECYFPAHCKALQTAFITSDVFHYSTNLHQTIAFSVWTNENNSDTNINLSAVKTINSSTHSNYEMRGSFSKLTQVFRPESSDDAENEIRCFLLLNHHLAKSSVNWGENWRLRRHGGGGTCTTDTSRQAARLSL